MDDYFGLMNEFDDYVEMYPDMDEEGYDGEHTGIKGIRADAPQKAKDAYAKWKKITDDALAQGWRFQLKDLEGTKKGDKEIISCITI